MAFLDSISNKIAQTGMNAVKGARDFSDTSRLNTQISAEERVIAENYKSIGEMYYEKYTNNYEEEFAAMIDNIRAAKEKIEEYRKEINKIKGEKKCVSCGAPLPKDARFCATCSAKQPAVESATAIETVQCPSCGASMPKNNKFCTKCGNEISIKKPATIPMPGQKIEKDHTIEKRICVCGATLKEGNAFCTACGRKYEEQTQEIIEDVESNLCPMCGAEVMEGDRFCTSCGFRYVENDDIEEMPVEESVADEAITKEDWNNDVETDESLETLGESELNQREKGENGSFCKSCGTAIIEGNKFCINCGNPI